MRCYGDNGITEGVSELTAASSVHAARKSRGLTQKELALRAGVDQGRVSRSEDVRENPRFGTVERLLAAADHRLYAAPTRRDDAATIAIGIRESLKASDARLALRYLIQLNDNLAAEHGLVRGVLAVAEPPLTGQKVWDAALAALVAWRLNEEQVPLPDWVAAPSRRLAHTRVLRVDPADPTPSAADTPAEFLQHGLLTWRDTFASV